MYNTVQSPTRGTEAPEVQVDLGNMAGFIGRIKAPPVCDNETLRKESMSPDELSKFSFSLEIPKESLCTTTAREHERREPPIVSSSSSTGSGESAYSSEHDGSGIKQVSTPRRLELEQSGQINQKVTSQKISRNGRQTQRWATDPSSQRVYRMVTGCVPIVEGGRVLFVSSSRKPEWILPKGGWEKDEKMEESAIRECYEEAGVLGVLGPRLNEIEYETRKAKKRRLELQELRRKAKVLRDAQSDSPGCSVHESGDDAASVKEDSAQEGSSNAELPRIREPTKQTDETSSVVSDASQGYSHVRMTLMPLYVSEVKSEWPESGRFRKAVEIDEAIRMCETRPELQAALKQVKERDLHHLHKEELQSLCSSRR